MKKVIFLAVILVMILAFSSCTRVTDYPDISGTWHVAMNPYAQNIEFNMTITQEPMTPVFSAITDNPDIEFVEGGVTRTSIGKFNMKITVDGTLYWLFGDITEDMITGFLRIGENGDIVGY